MSAKYAETFIMAENLHITLTRSAGSQINYGLNVERVEVDSYVDERKAGK